MAHHSSLIPRSSRLFKMAVKSNFPPWGSLWMSKSQPMCALRNQIPLGCLTPSMVLFIRSFPFQLFVTDIFFVICDRYLFRVGSLRAEGTFTSKAAMDRLEISLRACPNHLFPTSLAKWKYKLTNFGYFSHKRRKSHNYLSLKRP